MYKQSIDVDRLRKIFISRCRIIPCVLLKTLVISIMQRTACKRIHGTVLYRRNNRVHHNDHKKSKHRFLTFIRSEYRFEKLFRLIQHGHMRHTLNVKHIRGTHETQLRIKVFQISHCRDANQFACVIFN